MIKDLKEIDNQAKHQNQTLGKSSGVLARMKAISDAFIPYSKFIEWLIFLSFLAALAWSALRH